jgi:hypothetical protein
MHQSKQTKQKTFISSSCVLKKLSTWGTETLDEANSSGEPIFCDELGKVRSDEICKIVVEL